jgi:hypothetical protein
MGDADYLVFFGEACSGKVQYGARTELCNFISENVAGKEIEEGEKALIKYFREGGEDISHDWVAPKFNITINPNGNMR